MIEYKWNAPLTQAQVMALYESVQWTAYTEQPDTLMSAIHQSLGVLSAWDGERLVGLIRVVGNG